MTDGGANVVGRHDYLPFGEEIPASTAGRDAQWGAGNDPVNQKFTGKERDSESGLDYFGARYYGGALGRWGSPDAVNLTDDRLMNPSNTVNKYVYGGNNPFKFVDPDGKDITIFYEAGYPLPGHIMMLAYNQDAGATAARSFGPNHDYASTFKTALPFSPVSGTDGFGLTNLKSADELRKTFASITIQTSPEIAQQVIDQIINHPDGNYTTYFNNCTTTCAKILRDVGLLGKGILDYRPLIPEGMMNDLYHKYGNGQASSGSGGPIIRMGGIRGTLGKGTTLFNCCSKLCSAPKRPIRGLRTEKLLALTLNTHAEISAGGKVDTEMVGACSRDLLAALLYQCGTIVAVPMGHGARGFGWFIRRRSWHLRLPHRFRLRTIRWRQRGSEVTSVYGSLCHLARDCYPFGRSAGGVAEAPELAPLRDKIVDLFAGKERDSESGLDYFGARYYWRAGEVY